MFKRLGLVLMMAALFITAATGCGSKEGASGTEGKTADAKKNPDPVTLKLYQFGLSLTDADFQKLFADPVKKKFPNITLELVKSGPDAGPGTQPEDLLAAGDFPDILFSSNPNIQRLDELGVLANLAPLVKQSNVDLNRFEPVLVDAIKQYAKNGELFALPFSRNYSPLFYNKDIFDKFGVGYPKDGMTWDDVNAVAQKVTRSDGGINYRGFDYGQAPVTTGSALSLNMVNPKTNLADINTDGWKKAFTMMQRMYAIPGNLPDKTLFGALGKIRKDFAAGNLAMFMDKGNGLVPILQDLENSKKPLNWDMVSSPNFPEALGTEGVVDIHLFEIYAKGKHQAESFKVIDYLTSKEVEMLAAQGGRVTSLTDKEVQKSYGAELSTLKGKHIDAIFNTKPAKLQYPSEYNGIVSKYLYSAFKSVNLDGQDINTALRTAEEAANKEIQEKKAQ